jgi:ABC-type tungstate transport system permease subunit
VAQLPSLICQVKEQVEATESCDINISKFSTQAQVHKTREASFVNSYSEVQVYASRKTKYTKAEPFMKFCMKRQGGKGEVF